MIWLRVAVIFLLFAYLLAALLRPEKFWSFRLRVATPRRCPAFPQW